MNDVVETLLKGSVCQVKVNFTSIDLATFIVCFYKHSCPSLGPHGHGDASKVNLLGLPLVTSVPVLTGAPAGQDTRKACYTF